MNEHFLHFVWKNGLFDKGDLRTISGLDVEIINEGLYNRDSGPDFLDARLRIGETVWAGNIEIHHRSSSWFEHKHHLDRAYNNVILHVVSYNDRHAVTAGGVTPETIEIKADKDVVKRYSIYMQNGSLIACKNDIHLLDSFFIRHQIFQLAVERLERKTRRIREMLNQTLNDWEEVLFRLLASNIGLNINRQPFEQLARIVPLRLIRKHSDSLMQVEALLFGQAGMLNPELFSTKDKYCTDLKKEYHILKALYGLSPMDPWLWKFHRMRPVNFPTRRISQLAYLMAKNENLFRKILESNDNKELSELLHSEVSLYWKNHYRFGKEVRSIPASAGKSQKDTLLINSIIPLVWLYGKMQKREALCDRALDLADALPAENNRLTRQWANAGFEAVSSLESQGLIELSESYCKNRKCLNCHIGTKLISLGKKFGPDSTLILGEPL